MLEAKKSREGDGIDKEGPSFLVRELAVKPQPELFTMNRVHSKDIRNKV